MAQNSDRQENTANTCRSANHLVDRFPKGVYAEMLELHQKDAAHFD